MYHYEYKSVQYTSSRNVLDLLTTPSGSVNKSNTSLLPVLYLLLVVLTKLKSMVPPLNSREDSEVRIERAIEKLTDITLHNDRNICIIERNVNCY